MTIKTKHTYRESFEVGIYYTYNKKHKKVYDIKSLREDFKELLNKIK